MRYMMANRKLEQLAAAVSWLCGWLYFSAWSISFYPQILLNIRRRTTQGLTPDFPLLNIVGFSCYTISSAVFLYSPTIREQYAARHPISPTPTVRFNDLTFGAHAWLLSVIVYSQFYPVIWGWKDTSNTQLSVDKISLGLIWGGILAVAVTTSIVLVGGNAGYMKDSTDWAWIDVVYSLTYIKLLLTVFKYIPQVVANFRRRSTMGWSVWQVLLDFTGGSLSLLQLVVDSALQADWSGIIANPLKLGLANISLLFDIVFIVQHYVLFGPVEEQSASREDSSPSHDPDESSPLLPSSRDRRDSSI